MYSIYIIDGLLMYKAKLVKGVQNKYCRTLEMERVLTNYQDDENESKYSNNKAVNSQHDQFEFLCRLFVVYFFLCAHIAHLYVVSMSFTVHPGIDLYNEVDCNMGGNISCNDCQERTAEASWLDSGRKKGRDNSKNMRRVAKQEVEPVEDPTIVILWPAAKLRPYDLN